MTTIEKRLDFARKLLEKTNDDLAVIVGITGAGMRQAIKRDSLKPYYVSMIADALGISKDWLNTGDGDIFTNDPGDLSKVASYLQNEQSFQVNELKVKDPLDLGFYENNNGNSFVRIDNGKYLMTLPLVDYHVQAGFMDHSQDKIFLGDLQKHTIIVDKPAQGKYLAFRVRGDSMDDGSANAIRQGDIVSARELQRSNWQNKLHLHKFKKWVIFSKTSTYPLIKEIVSHDTENGTITCHSYNDAPEFKNDFTLNIDEITGLYNVIDVSPEIKRIEL